MRRSRPSSNAGVPFSEGRCLAAIGASSPLSVNDLARRANLNKGQASRAAPSLVDQLLARKVAGATDGRGVVLTLTAKGEKVWQRVMRVIERRNDAIVSCLDTAEVRQLNQLLDRLVEHARGAAGEGVDATEQRLLCPVGVVRVVARRGRDLASESTLSPASPGRLSTAGSRALRVEFS